MIKECTAYEELFAAWLDGEVPLDEKLEIARHLQECGTCRKELADMKSHWERVAALAPTQTRDNFIKRKQFKTRFSLLIKSLKETILRLSSRRGRGNGV